MTRWTALMLFVIIALSSTSNLYAQEKGAEPPAESDAKPIEQPLADPGWSFQANTIGIVAASVTGGFLLIASLLVGLVSTPIISAGGRSARDSHPDVIGIPASRLVGWVSYGVFSVVGGAAVVAAATGDDIGAALALPLVLLGMTVELVFALEARTAGIQASRIREEQQN